MTPRAQVAFSRWLAAAAALGLALAPARSAAPAAPGPRAVPAAPSSGAPAPALAVLDRLLARYDALLARDDDARHQASSRLTLNALTQRRAALGAAFDQAKCDDLRAEMILQYQRLAAWVGAGPR